MRRRPRLRSRARRGIAPGINLTPLLDTTLNLLFFFLLVTTLRREEFGAEVKLPASETAGALSGEADAVTLDTAGRIFFRGREMGESELELELVQLARSGKTEIAVRGDEAVTLGRFHAIMDVCRRAGLKTIQMQAQRKPAGP